MGAILNYTPKREAEISKPVHPLVHWQAVNFSKKKEEKKRIKLQAKIKSYKA